MPYFDSWLEAKLVTAGSINLIAVAPPSTIADRTAELTETVPTAVDESPSSKQQIVAVGLALPVPR